MRFEAYIDGFSLYHGDKFLVGPGALNGASGDGVGGHWWYQLTPADLFGAQLPTAVGHLQKPAPW